jgi:Fe-S cluster assembly iron-binding protein IscA
LLTLTPNAASMIRTLVDQSEAAEAGGMRIASDHGAGALTLSLAAVPAEDDQVVEMDGARIFLDPQAAAILDDKTLDADATPDGRPQFGIADQPG